MTTREVLERYPRVVAHVICESLGYATPSCAAGVVADALAGRENWCEWILACYGGDPTKAVQQAIEGRHRHRGFMADYAQARAIVEHERQTGEGPLFASWM